MRFFRFHEMVVRGEKKQRLSLRIVSLLIIGWSLFYICVLTRTINCQSEETTTRDDQRTVNYLHPAEIYGHIHIAKTGGTTINANLSLHYERICGHKGYSFDAIGNNKRFKKSGHKMLEVHDSYSNLTAGFGFNRGRVPGKIMEEIGFEDCDWISDENNWRFWMRFQRWPLPFQLHVPCRSPVDHLMSQCNHRKIIFDCNNTVEDMVKQIDTCLLFISGRYSKALNESLNVKCYDFAKTDVYTDWIGQHLQRRRIEAEFSLRATNKQRLRNQECIWERPEVQRIVTNYLVETYDYYRFCERCLGSNQDLFVAH